MKVTEFEALLKLAVMPSVMITALQRALKERFGAGATSEVGECTLMIGPDRVELIDARNRIEARGPAHVATVLVRKRKKK